MLFQNMGTTTLIIMAVSLILVDILLLRIALAITKAQVKTNMKWVASSFGIQLGIIFFIGSPLILFGMIGQFGEDEGEMWSIIAIVVIFSMFIDVNVINVIHKIGLKRSIVVVFFVAGPIITALYILGRSLGGIYS